MSVGFFNANQRPAWSPYFGGRSGLPLTLLDRVELPDGEDRGLPAETASEDARATMALYHPDVLTGLLRDALYQSSVRAREALVPYVDALSLSGYAPTEDCVTPLDASTKLPNLFYKREDLTATKAYKVRGAVTAMLRAMEKGKRHFVAASTGNHALGVLKAAELLRPDSVRVLVPENVSATKWEKLSETVEALRDQGLDASLVKEGKTFDETRRLAQESLAADEYYVDPYAHHSVVAGQGTLGLELVDQLKDVLANHVGKNNVVRELVVVAPVGGGGLLSGAATAVTQALESDPALRHVKPRFVGLRLKDQEASLGDAIRVREVSRRNQKRLDALGVEIREELDDESMARAQRLVRKDIGARVEGGSAGTLLPVLDDPDLRPSDERVVVCLLSGGNVSEE